MIFILLAGAPSHTDTFDFKVVNGVTPATFNPDTVNGSSVAHRPAAEAGADDRRFRHRALDAVARAGAFAGADLDADRPQSRRRRWATSRRISAAWWRSKRTRSAAFGRCSPPSWRSTRAAAWGRAICRRTTRRSRCTPATGGIANTTNPDGQTRFTNRSNLLHSLDDTLRTNSPNGSRWRTTTISTAPAQAVDVQPGGEPGLRFHRRGQPALRQHGGTGNACLVATQVLKANQGTRFIQITSQRRLGHAPEHLRGRHAAGQGADSGQRRLGAARAI